MSKNPQNQSTSILLQGVQSIIDDNYKEGETPSLMKQGKEIDAKCKTNINSQKCIYIKLCYACAALEEATVFGNIKGKISVTISPGSQTFIVIPHPVASLSYYNNFFTYPYFYIFQKYIQFSTIIAQNLYMCLSSCLVLSFCRQSQHLLTVF